MDDKMTYTEDSVEVRDMSVCTTLNEHNTHPIQHRLSKNCQTVSVLVAAITGLEISKVGLAIRCERRV